MRAGLEPGAQWQCFEVTTLALVRRSVGQHLWCRRSQSVDRADQIEGSEHIRYRLGVIYRSGLRQPVDPLAPGASGQRHTSDPDWFVIAKPDDVAHVSQAKDRV